MCACVHVYVPQIVASCRRRACTAWRRAHRRHAFGETGAKVTYVLSVIASLGVAAANVTFVGQTIVSLLEANGFTADEVPPLPPVPSPASHPPRAQAPSRPKPRRRNTGGRVLELACVPTQEFTVIIGSSQRRSSVNSPPPPHHPHRASPL